MRPGTVEITPAYPVCTPSGDDRFTLALLAEAWELLQRHGYPAPRTASDHVALQAALHQVLYGADPGRVAAGPADRGER